MFIVSEFSENAPPCHGRNLSLQEPFHGRLMVTVAVIFMSATYFRHALCRHQVSRHRYAAVALWINGGRAKHARPSELSCHAHG